MVLEQRRIDTKALLYIALVVALLLIALNCIPRELLAKLYYVAVLPMVIVLFILTLKAKSAIH